MKIFTVDTRCSHGELLAFGESECATCKWDKWFFSHKIPFRVKCIDDKNSNLEKGSIYTVVAIIESGKLEHSTPLPCVLLRSGSAFATVHGYDFRRFMPTDD